jgi:hypothetical protein
MDHFDRDRVKREDSVLVVCALVHFGKRLRMDLERPSRAGLSGSS